MNPTKLLPCAHGTTHKVGRRFFKPIPAAALLALLTACAVAFFAGCAPIKPGSDPVVVQTERGQTISGGALAFVIDLDHSDRGFWRTNAPAFHSFAERLRTPVPVQGLLDGSTSLPLYIAVQWQVDRAKLDYKAVKSQSSSNAVLAATEALRALVDQANAWSMIVTNKR